MTGATVTQITPAQLRSDFPAFASQEEYTNETIVMWATVAQSLINGNRWPDAPVQTVALELMICHMLSLDKRANDEAAAGAQPGAMNGAVTGKSVDKARITFDTSTTTEADAGHWNLTIYGVRFARMAKMAGMGPLQAGIGFDPTGGLNGPGWPGPWPWPAPGGTGFSS